MYPALKFVCRLTAPFHTSDRNYSNLYTCAPYIMGSTLRGAVLRCLIDRYCTRIHDLHEDNPGYHGKCGEPCPVKPLFFPPTRFSFGHFSEEESDVAVYTRVGISRDRNAAAEGALVSVEVRRGEFTFEVMYPDVGLEPYIHEGVMLAGCRRDVGIGRFRSVGWGQFDVLCCECAGHSIPAKAKRYVFEFRTPYVLPEEASGGEIPKVTFRDQLQKALLPDTSPVPCIDKIETMIPSFSYVRRWSDEKGSKENRMVADIGSKLIVTFSEDVDPNHLYLWQWGVGDWYEYGFGSFSSTVV